MTWHADQTEGRPDDVEKAKLLKKRDAIQAQIVALKNSPCGTTNSAKNGRIEDLTALAKKMTSIDKKLGRN